MTSRTQCVVGLQRIGTLYRPFLSYILFCWLSQETKCVLRDAETYGSISASAGQAGRAAVLEEADNSYAEHYSISRLHPLWFFLFCSWVTTLISWHMFSVCSSPFYILPMGILEAFLPSTHKCTLMSLKPQKGLTLGA